MIREVFGERRARAATQHKWSKFSAVSTGWVWGGAESRHRCKAFGELFWPLNVPPIYILGKDLNCHRNEFLRKALNSGQSNDPLNDILPAMQ